MHFQDEADPDWPAIKKIDVERHAHDTSYLDNRDVKCLSWNDVSVTVHDRETKKPRRILSGISGHVVAGEFAVETW